MKRLYADIHRKIGGFDLNVLIDSDAARIGILGESGSGKSMTLKSIAGIEPVDSGHIEVEGRVLYDSSARTDLKPQRRNVGYMFQNYALFPTMTVMKNVMAGLGKQTEENRNKAAVSEVSFPNSGTIPVVNEVVAHLGMAKKGPIVKYNKQVNTYPYPLPTFEAKDCNPSECVFPIAATPRIGIPTAVMTNPAIA